MEWDYDHILRIGGDIQTPADPSCETAALRKRIEPWLSAVFQSEHLSLLLGNGFTTAIADRAGARPVSMAMADFDAPNTDKVNAYAEKMAGDMDRTTANIEDQISAALSYLAAMQILEHDDASPWQTAIDKVLGGLITDILATEQGIRGGLDKVPATSGALARDILVSFLMSFASRVASRERLHIFTTNYDRLIERGCDLAGLRIIDRFVGAIEPEFRSSRLEVDMHYMPPGIRGEPRHLEGVVHLTKLHGSLDWRYESPRLYRTALPFGAEKGHPCLPDRPRDSLMIYPNAAKDIETAVYPYADLFRDFSAAICQPNSVLVTYGYGYGDDHVNRIIADMLTIPSSHLVIIAWGEKPHERIASFVARVGRLQQTTLLVGKHFADITTLVEHYLPKPAIDPLTIRMTELIERRDRIPRGEPGDDEAAS